MARKPNYGLNRSEVSRAKQARQEEKQRQHEEVVARRRAARGGTAAADTVGDALPDSKDAE